MTTAHLIYGFLGVGKTTLARSLEQELPAIRFSRDEWMARLYGIDPPIEHFPEYFQRISDQIDAVWPRCLQLGLDVVLDMGFWTRRERDVTREKVKLLGANARLYHVTCAEHETRRRIALRNNDLKGSLYIAENTFEELKRRFEPLGSDEDHVEIAT